MTQRTHWNQTLSAEGLAALQQPGGVIVCPTKVGYIIMATDKAGLERKFDAKERKRNKPASSSAAAWSSCARSPN